MTKIEIAALACLGAFAGPAITAELAHQTLRVEVNNLRNIKGDVGCGLFSSADGFPDNTAKAQQVQHVQIVGKAAVCEFSTVIPGTYAVAVFHDENGNGVLDKNLLGIPKEGYGTSNNVRPAMSAPQFKDAAFAVGTAKQPVLTINVGY